MAVSNRRSGSYFWTRVCEGADNYAEMCEMRAQMDNGFFDLSPEEEVRPCESQCEELGNCTVYIDCHN